MDFKKGLDAVKGMAEDKGVDLSIESLKELILKKTKDGEESNVKTLLNDKLSGLKDGNFDAADFNSFKENLMPHIKEDEQEPVKQALATILQKFGK